MEIAEKCLLMTSLAILVCHPSSTIRCFKPKPSCTSPKKETTTTSKSKKVLVFNSCTNNCVSSKLNVHKPRKLFEEIVEGAPSRTIVEAIFRSGWKHGVRYTIDKILKVNHSEKISENFEECKKMVNSRLSTRNKRTDKVLYHGATITCSLGFDKSPRICNKKTCGVCRIIGHNYGIEKTNWTESFSSSSWSAHKKVIKQFGDGVSKKAIILYRVIATCREKKGDLEVKILKPMAILPCFVIIYSLP